jgi:hypothetical protein
MKILQSFTFYVTVFFLFMLSGVPGSVLSCDEECPKGASLDKPIGRGIKSSLRFSNDQITDQNPLKISRDRIGFKFSLKSSSDSLPDDMPSLRRVRSCVSFESESLSGLSSPLRPASPFALESEYLEVGTLARPGAGTLVSEDNYHVISSAVMMAAYMTPDMGSNTFESIKSFCKKHYTFPAQEERYEGDWSDLEQSLREVGKKSFKLIGYGSLIDPESSTEFSIKGDPVLAFGVRRDTSFFPPCPELSPLGMPPSPYEKDLLRFAVKYTGDYENAINGRLVEINLGQEFEDLRVRERGYDLIKVPVVRFESKEKFKMHLEDAYILAQSQGDKENVRPLDFSPHMAYLYVCLRGAMHLSKSMPRSTHALSFFLLTTHVGDKKLGDWLRARSLEGGSGDNISPRAYFQQIKQYQK